MSGPEDPEVLARVRGALPFVEKVAKRFSRTLRGLVEFDDIVAHGRVGLLDAARRFDPSRGVPFEAYAQFRIKGAILEAARAAGLPRGTYEKIRAAEEAVRFQKGMLEETFVAFGGGKPALGGRLAEVMASMATAVTLGVIAESGEDDYERVAITRADPEEALEKEQLMALVKECIDDLPDDEREIVRRHYFEGEKFYKVAADLGIGKPWASRLHSRAIGRIAERVRRETG